MDVIATSMIIGYLVTVTVVGSLLARRSKTSSQWAVAGGGLGMMMIAMGVAGTRIGGAGTYGVAGEVIREGMWNLWYGVGTFLAMAVVAFGFAIPYRRLKLQTVGEIFWVRFRSRRCQRLVSLCVQTEYFIVNIIEPYVIALIVQGAMGIPFGVAVYFGAMVIIIYTALGGLWGSAVTNTLHCTVILLALSAVGFAGLNHLGGWSSMTQAIGTALTESGKDEAAWWSFTGAGWGVVIGMLFSAVIHTPAASVYVNFSSAAKNERILIPAYLIGGLIGAAMSVLAAWIGMETLAKYGADAQLGSYSAITRLATDINPWLGGIALAAILAAVISSGGPILLSSATMFVNDWLPFARNLSPQAKLSTFRITTVLYGLLAATIAWLGSIESILDLLLFGFSMVVPPAIAVGYLIYWRRTTEKAAFWGTLIGYCGGLLWYVLTWWATKTGLELSEASTGLWRSVHYLLTYDGQGMDPSYVTTLIPLVLIPMISLSTSEDLDGQEDFYAKVSRR